MDGVRLVLALWMRPAAEGEKEGLNEENGVRETVGVRKDRRRKMERGG